MNGKETTRAHRPHRHLTDGQLDVLIQNLRAEQRLRREDAGHFHRDSRPINPLGYGRGYVSDVIRRRVRSWP
jgi:hypothetical protein